MCLEKHLCQIVSFPDSVRLSRRRFVARLFNDHGSKSALKSALRRLLCKLTGKSGWSAAGDFEPGIAFCVDISPPWKDKLSTVFLHPLWSLAQTFCHLLWALADHSPTSGILVMFCGLRLSVNHMKDWCFESSYVTERLQTIFCVYLNLTCM
ncbi:hypothetical protein NPIL_109301 [Nephila pilipes]|uniref:Uncharacterized protein n=1 Tax=Nephila pilipes TaxID=299642 RepID=A0A8X6MQ80_NEPPI|nr:hypothetical protein NPIL_109301 [Nephila pilipes]